MGPCCKTGSIRRQAATVFEKDPSLQILRKKYTTKFFKTFQKGCAPFWKKEHGRKRVR